MSDDHMQIGETAKEQYLMKWLQGVQALAMLSAATSAATIMHEWGYAHYWGIPDLFVRLTPALIVEHSFLKAVGWLAIAVVTHFMFKQDHAVLNRRLLSQGASLARRKRTKAVGQVAAYAPAAAPLVVELLKLLEVMEILAGPEGGFTRSILQGVACFLIASALCWLLYTIAHHADRDGNALLLILLLVGVFGSWVDGWRNGKSQKDFAIASHDGSSFVALRAYDDKVVARPLVNGCTIDETVLLDGTQLRFTLGHIDRLHLCPGECHSDAASNARGSDDPLLDAEVDLQSTTPIEDVEHQQIRRVVEDR